MQLPEIAASGTDARVCCYQVAREALRIVGDAEVLSALSYAMSGTDTAYRASGLRACYAMSGTDNARNRGSDFSVLVETAWFQYLNKSQLADPCQMSLKCNGPIDAVSYAPDGYSSPLHCKLNTRNHIPSDVRYSPRLSLLPMLCFFMRRPVLTWAMFYYAMSSTDVGYALLRNVQY
eukprot:2881879-Rhodomonas_salina.3